MKVLAGDIGGTHARLALIELRGRTLRVLEQRTYDSRAHPGLEPIAQTFLRETGARPERACFGIAGPVVNGEVRTSNLPWRVSTSGMAAALELPRTRLINDLLAVARGITRLASDDFEVLQAGHPPAADPAAAPGVGPATPEELAAVGASRAPAAEGVRAVIAAGTGLGEAILVRNGRRWRALASEGGHASFAPRNQLEWDLRQFLSARFHGHVSNERILSGPGLRNVFDFLAERAAAGGASSEGARVNPEVLAEVEREGERAVSRHGLAGTDSVCVQALDLFCSVLGAVAGDLALITLARSGLYVAGGIAPAILPALRRGAFLDAFHDKGRMARVVGRVPVYVVTNGQVGLYGAATAAAEDMPRGR